MLHWHPKWLFGISEPSTVSRKKCWTLKVFCLHIMLQIWHILLILGESLVLECIGYVFFSWNHLSEAAMEASRAEASEREHRLSSKLMTQAQAFGVGWVGKGYRNGKSQLTGWIWKEMTGSWRMHPAWWWFQVIFQVGWNNTNQPVFGLAIIRIYKDSLPSSLLKTQQEAQELRTVLDEQLKRQDVM